MATERTGTAADGEELGECSCKVRRSAARYGLEGLDAELVDRWVGEEESASLRELEEYVNTALVRAALEGSPEGVIEGEAANYYRLLTEDDTSEGTRVEARRRLERRGIDPDDLVASFVSHQTIHTHLRKCLEVSYDRETDPAERVENARTFLQGTQRRTERITAGTLEQLRDGDALDLAEFTVFLDTMVSCDDCGRVLPVSDVFEHGGCPCQVGD